MKIHVLSALMVALVWTFGVLAYAQDSPPATAPENTLDACQDRLDNDGDGYVDCEDQDCHIFSMCLEKSEPAQAPSPASVPLSAPATVSIVQETGRQCRDGVDNDGDGLVDCQEASCQGYYYCKKRMHERPLRQDAPQGLIVSLGLGAALPHYDFPSTAVVNSRYGKNIPFDPDLGGMVNLKLGYAPLKWLGFGLTWKGAGTFGSNEFKFFDSRDDAPGYKYEADKEWRHAGAFARLTYPFGRFVPYLDISGGYTRVKYEWQIYSDRTSWAEIDDWSDYEDERWWDSDFEDRDVQRLSRRHFTLALEPGFDYFVVPQTFAIGLQAYLPVFASSNPSTDNLGAMLTFTVTPTWRGRPKLKAEYQRP
jgi:hypothetical protein